MQSNLCVTTILGTGKKWSLFRGGRYSEGWSKFILSTLFNNLEDIFSKLARKVVKDR